MSFKSFVASFWGIGTAGTSSSEAKTRTIIGEVFFIGEDGVRRLILNAMVEGDIQVFYVDPSIAPQIRWYLYRNQNNLELTLSPGVFGVTVTKVVLRD